MKRYYQAHYYCPNLERDVTTLCTTKKKAQEYVDGGVWEGFISVIV